MDENIVSKSIKGCLNFGFKIVSFWFKLWLLPINSIFEWVLERVKPILDPLFLFFSKNRSKLLKYSLFSIFYLLFLLVVTILVYYAIYSTIVPKVSTEEPLFFDYSFKTTKKIVADVQAAVEFQKNKHYSIYLELELPESPKNQDIGMFMACMDIDNHDAWNPQKIYHTCRPAMLKYSSSLLKSMKSVFFSIPYLFGLYEEKQIIVLPMGESFIANRFYQSISASIQINNPDIQIYKASLKFLANLNGLDYYLYYYPVTSFIIGCSVVYISLVCSTAFIIVSLFLYRHFNREEEELENEMDHNDVLVGEDSWEDENEIGEEEEEEGGEEEEEEEVDIQQQEQSSSSMNNIPIAISRRNGASTISTQKRKPIWEIIDDENIDVGASSSSNLSSTFLSNKNDDKLGLFSSPNVKPSQSDKQQQYYKELDEAFNQSIQNKYQQQHQQRQYSWEKDDHIIDEKKLSSTSSPLLRSINNNNYNVINDSFNSSNNSKNSEGNTPRSPPLIVKKKKSFKYSSDESDNEKSTTDSGSGDKENSNDDDYADNENSTLPSPINVNTDNSEISTSVAAVTQINDHEQLQQEQTIPKAIINLASDNNQLPQGEDNNPPPPPYEQSPKPNLEQIVCDDNDKDDDNNKKNKEDEENKKNDSSSEEEIETGNSGYANDEWVKISSDSLVRKRKQ